MIEGQDVVCDEGELTGEPDGVPKGVVNEESVDNHVQGTLMAKSLVTSGFGKALVLAVGKNTIAGSISMNSMKR